MSFHERFQGFIDESGLSKERIARLAGVDPRTVRDTYAGENIPLPEVLKDILEKGLGLGELEAAYMEALRQIAENLRKKERMQRIATRKQKYRETEGEIQSIKKIEA